VICGAGSIARVADLLSERARNNLLSRNQIDVANGGLSITPIVKSTLKHDTDLMGLTIKNGLPEAVMPFS